MKNLLTTEAFADWCEKQPVDQYYDYGNANICAAAQYLKAVGVLRFALMSDELPVGWEPCLNPPLGFGAYTFGALAQRLRSA